MIAMLRLLNGFLPHELSVNVYYICMGNFFGIIIYVCIGDYVLTKIKIKIQSKKFIGSIWIKIRIVDQS